MLQQLLVSASPGAPLVLPSTLTCWSSAALTEEATFSELSLAGKAGKNVHYSIRFNGWAQQLAEALP